MADSELTHQEELVYAETTTVLNELMARRYNELKQKYDGGTLTPSDFAASFADMFDDMGDLLQRYAERGRESGMANLADALTVWGNDYKVRATQAKAALSQDDVDLAIDLILGVADELSENERALDVIETHFGFGARGLVKKAIGAASHIGAGYTGYEAMVDFYDGNSKSGSARLFSLVVGVAAGAFITAGAAAPIVIAVTIGATVALLGTVAESAFNGVASMFGWEDPKDAQAAVLRAIKDRNNVVLAHLGNHLFWGTDGNDVFVGFDDKPNDMVGGDGDDVLEGNAKADYLNGGNGNDDLQGAAGDDRLKGGDGDDTLDGGRGNDSLAGGLGRDVYRFGLDDFVNGVTEDTIVDSDGVGVITYAEYKENGTPIGLGDSIQQASLGAWQTSDEQFRLVVDGDVDKALVIIHRQSGSRIVVQHWKNGDLGISLPDYVASPLPEVAPLTSGEDVFGANGANAGQDNIGGLAGNDAIEGGAGDDVIDGGWDDDLIFGGAGNDRLLGGAGNDTIIDGSELMTFEDWSDTVDADGTTQRQRIEDDIAQLGAAVIARGKGWYIRLDSLGASGTALDGGFTIVTAKDRVDLDPNASPSGNDVIDAGDGADRVFAGEGDDTIVGGLGDDFLDGGHDDDIINGGDGNDIILGDLPDGSVPHVALTALVSDGAKANGNDILDGGAGNDIVTGGGGNDIIYGGDGDDQLAGRGSSNPVDAGDSDRDYIDGGLGNDTIYGDDGDDSLLGGDGNDIIRGDNARVGTVNGNDTILGGAGDDQLSGDGGDDTLYGEDGADVLNGDNVDIDGSLHGKDALYGGAGNDQLFGFGGDDILYGGDDDDVLVGDADASQLDAQYHGNDVLFGGEGNDNLFGNGGDDLLDGGNGNDTLSGGDGNDQLAGGAGIDLLDGGAGNDSLDGGADDDQLTGGAGDDVLSGGIGNDRLRGSAGADQLSGGDGDDYLEGDDAALPAAQHGNDTLDGGDGNDTIYGQGGNDTIKGGSGDDLLLGDDQAGSLSGDDAIYGGAGDDHLDGGAGTDQLSGDEGNDVLLGGAGDDDLTGGSGNDQLVGGAGNDSYHFESGFGIDRILQVAGEDAGQDIISFGSSIQLADLRYSVSGDDLVIQNMPTGDVLSVRDYFGPGASIDIHFADGGVQTKADLEQQLGVTAAPIIGSGGGEVDGTDGNDRIYGDDGDNTIYGLLGDDYINGGAGDDRIFGGPGADTLEGGAGNDTYTVGSGFDTVMGLGDSDGGSDTILCNCTPQEVTNYQVSGNDLLIFIGSTGEDAVRLEGFLAETNGTHVIQFSDGSKLTADAFRTNPSSWTGTSGNDVFQGGAADDLLHGMGGDDVISGGGGDDHIYGDDGYDVLRGDAGNDNLTDLDGTLYGGTGDDNYYVIHDPYSVLYGIPVDIVENPGEGTDTVYTNAYDAALPDNVENLVAKPSTWILHGYGGSVDPRDLVGNALDNVITVDTLSTNIPDDIVYKLDGGAGADTLNGSRFDDIYVVDNPNDVIVEPGTGANQSFDIVQAKYSYHLDPTSNIEEVQLLGSENLSAWGTDGADILDGSTSSGSNVLTGGSGDDQYVLGVLDGDTVVEDAGGGNDTVTLTLSMLGVPGTPTSFSVSDYANVENLTLEDVEFTLTGSDAGGNLNGDAGDNVLTGNGYTNVIHGGDGNDTVIGGDHPGGSSLSKKSDDLYGDAGDDTIKAGWGGGDLHGGDGNDMLDGGISSGSSLYGDDGNDTLMAGSGGSELYGGTGNDLLKGGQGADTFHYDAGDGTDTIASTPGTPLDQVVFGAHVSTDDVTFSRGGTTLIVQVGTDAANQLRVNNYWADTSADAALTGAIDQFVFADGTIRKGGLDRLPYTNNPPVTQLGYLDVETVGTSLFDYALPNGTFTDAPEDTLAYSLADGAPNWLAIDATTGALSGTTPNGGLDATFGLLATDTWGQTASTTIHLSVRNLIEGTDQADDLTGTAAKDDIHAGVGDDRLTGGQGDRLYGGIGDDHYVVADSSVQIVEYAGEGADTVESSSDYALGDNVENLTLVAGSQARNGTGNADDNVITGNAQGNLLDGGLGADRLAAGLGDDIYVVDQVGDTVIEQAGEGTDTIRSSVDWTLDDQVERIELLGTGNLSGTGNALDNDLVGNDGDNTLIGGAGTDRLYGGLGDDYLVLDTEGDQAFETTGEGSDTVERRFESNQVLADNVENLLLASFALTGNGNGLDNTITGSAAANTLAGYAGNDVLRGQGGDDVLFGGPGSDHLLGGDGNDYLDGGDGRDLLEGGSGNDTLAGGAGDDVLDGAAGDDSYLFGANAGNNVIQNTGGGSDGIFFTDGIDASRLSFTRDGDDLLIFVDAAATPAVWVVNHFLGGDATIAYVQPDGGNMLTAAQIGQLVTSGGGSGSTSYDNTMEGTASSEQLVGSAGKDLIEGLAGDDQLFGMAGDDTLRGGDGNDYLAGGNGSGSGSGADRLEGGAGNDTLVGEDGNDTLLGGAGDDQYVYGGGQDMIDNTDGGYDGVFFSDGITAGNLGFSRDGDDLLITVANDTGRTIRVTDHFLGGDYAIDYVQPASGSMLDTSTINTLAGGGTGGSTPSNTGNDSDYTTVVDGTAAGEQLLGTNGRDLIHGLGGDDTIFGFAGDDKFDGGDGDDYLSGGNGSFSGSGNDILIGGAGADTLVGEDGDDLLLGGAGDDSYVWQAGSDSDVIDNTGGGMDWLFFNGVDRTRLSFHQSGNDLIILVDDDVTQQVRVKDHFLGGDLAISYVQPSDGYAIPASQFGSMLTSMPDGFAATNTIVAASLDQSALTPTVYASSGKAVLHGNEHVVHTARRDQFEAEAMWAGLSNAATPWQSRLLTTDRKRSQAPADRHVQVLIDAMAQFHASASVVTDLHADLEDEGAWLASTHTSTHLGRRPQLSHMSNQAF